MASLLNLWFSRWHWCGDLAAASARHRSLHIFTVWIKNCLHVKKKFSYESYFPLENRFDGVTRSCSNGRGYVGSTHSTVNQAEVVFLVQTSHLSVLSGARWSWTSDVLDGFHRLLQSLSASGREPDQFTTFALRTSSTLLFSKCKFYVV